MISRTQSGNAAAIAIFLLFGLVGRVLADGCGVGEKNAHHGKAENTLAATGTAGGYVNRLRD
ncbi:MAG: hypothetical protein MI753_14160 [Hyphomicrobiales bacterium]|nr:hypothetical protein [Hyphomicrobiales bacterium]